MKNIIWITAIILAFVAGYFAHGANQETARAQSKAEPISQNNIVDAPKISNTELNQATKTVFAAKEKAIPTLPQDQSIPDSQPNTINTKSKASNPTTVTDTNGPTAKNYPNEISDEDIDKVLPAPFNQRLKNHHGNLREKYKDFAATSQQLEWDKNMQNKLSDAISSNPYAKFIILDSLQCKVNLCEIRLYETKEGAWSLIMAEMRLQDWWDIGGSSASGFGTDTPSKTGWYVLLPRR